MPEPVFIIAAVFVMWVLLKLAKIAVKLILLIISVMIIAAALWFMFAR